MSAYSALAGVYDQLMDDFDYPAWARYYMELIARSGMRPKTMCDCACGTGSLTVPFAQRGIRVTGVDISEPMLELAAEKARRNGVQAMFVRQDMCGLLLPRPVDALVCGCDGVNYLLTDAQVQAFFGRARESLKRGGVLAFDISSEYKLEHVLGSGFFGEERDDVAYLWANQYDKARRTVRMSLTFFRREEDDLYRRMSEEHVQRAHRPEDLTRMLSECGFENIQVFGDRTFDAPRPDELRIHFAATRG